MLSALSPGMALMGAMETPFPPPRCVHAPMTNPTCVDHHLVLVGPLSWLTIMGLCTAVAAQVGFGTPKASL